jgi:hypothetical protein
MVSVRRIILTIFVPGAMSSKMVVVGLLSSNILVLVLLSMVID